MKQSIANAEVVPVSKADVRLCDKVKKARDNVTIETMCGLSFLVD